MQPRDTSRLQPDPFDVLVVGGGIQGLTIAYEAASRGLRTALIEAADFGSGISFNHQKTVHGGLRSLQSLQLARVREGIRERRALARIAPWFLRPLPFVVGTYRSMFRSRAAMRAAFTLERWLARDRNEGVARELHLPPARLLSRALTVKLFPGIREANLTGGAQWYDYQMVENDRLTLAIASGAERAGCVALNYVRAIDAIRRDNRVVGITARDVVSGERLSIEARLTINATGASASDVMRMFGVERRVPLIAAMNLVTTRPAKEIALAAPTRAGRMLTLVPWRGRWIAGTSQSERLAAVDEQQATAAEVDRFVVEVNEAFPALKLTRADIALVHRGLVPAAVEKGTPQLLTAPAILDHVDDKVPGALTVIGVKYTTARAVAERSVSVAGRLLGRQLRRSFSATAVLPGAGIADHEGLAIETARKAGIDLPAAALHRLSTLYAERCVDVIRIASGRAELAAPLTAGTSAIGAEVLHVIRHEMALRLSDIVIRRTGLGAAGPPEREALSACARIAAAELKWADERMLEEMAAVDRFYELS
jgi:glycerol-3-phosphate dehydrogenase